MNRIDCMIRESFIFLERVGQKSEQKMWSSGITDWDSFLDCNDVPCVSSKVKHYFDRQLIEAKKHIKQDNANYFSDILPNGEMYRLYDKFKDDCVYLDIETTGYYGDITVLGLYGGGETFIMVRGKSLQKEAFERIMSKFKMVVTFNGSSFDLPIVEKYFGSKINMPHIDMRHVCSKVGLKGGLKNIEKELGITRVEEVQGVTGADAVQLWRAYRSTGNEKYLDLLVKYNEEDIINLKPLAEMVIPRVWESIRF
ncbi:ribonuclease H-like domain-containing protein [Candidatus Woesearchaeota archaeon]|nr:ribonuclease H-like domain-containing protein [Candidatus Woesearchaeota archaeon]